MHAKRYSLGNPELDDLIGGPEAGSVILLEGPPGAGKTTLALTIGYINSLKKKSRVLYLTANESVDKLLSLCEGLGFSMITKLVEDEAFKIIKVPIMRDKYVIDFVSKHVGEFSKDYDIIVIDSVTPITKILDGYELKRSWLQTIYDFITRFRKGLLVIVGDRMGADDIDLRLAEFVADIVLELDYRITRNGLIERFIRVKKYRGKGVRFASIPFTIVNGSGVVVLNYVSKERIKQFKEFRKPLSISCRPLQKILVDNIIEPGSQIMIIDERGWLHGSAFLRFLASLIGKLKKEGRSIEVISYDPWVSREMIRIMDELGIPKNAIAIREISLFSMSLNSVISETLRELMSNPQTEFMLAIGVEKLFTTYDVNEMKQLIYNTVNALRSLGITLVEYARVSSISSLPKYYIDLQDVVVAIRRRNNDTAIDVIKNVRASGPIRVGDKEFVMCIEKV